MSDHVRNIIEEISPLKIGINQSSEISLMSFSFDSWDPELKDHELKCLIHHDKLAMVKRALILFRDESRHWSHRDLVDTKYWEEECQYKILNVKSCRRAQNRVQLVDNAISESKDFAYEALDETLRSYTQKIYQEMRELQERRQDLVNSHRVQAERIMSDPLSIAAFVRNDAAIAARQRNEEMIEALEDQREFLGECVHRDHSHFSVGIKRGERNHKLYKLYSEELKKRTEEIDKFEIQLKNYIKDLKKSAPQNYDSFKTKLLAKREKVRLAEEKKKKAEEAKKRKAEKKAYDTFMKKITSTGLGLRELSSNNQEKKAYTSEASAQKEAIRRSGESGEYITVYSKNFQLIDGTDGYGKPHTFWFLTSNKSVTKAA